MTTNNKQRITLFLNQELLIHARAEAIIENLTLSTIVEKSLMKYLPKEIVIKKPEINGKI